jgi:hypothetical protein
MLMYFSSFCITLFDSYTKIKLTPYSMQTLLMERGLVAFDDIDDRIQCLSHYSHKRALTSLKSTFALKAEQKV